MTPDRRPPRVPDLDRDRLARLLARAGRAEGGRASDIGALIDVAEALAATPGLPPARRAALRAGLEARAARRFPRPSAGEPARPRSPRWPALGARGAALLALVLGGLVLLGVWLWQEARDVAAPASPARGAATASHDDGGPRPAQGSGGTLGSLADISSRAAPPASDPGGAARPGGGTAASGATASVANAERARAQQGGGGPGADGAPRPPPGATAASSGRAPEGALASPTLRTDSDAPVGAGPRRAVTEDLADSPAAGDAARASPRPSEGGLAAPIRGRVLDERGRGIAGALVTAYRDGDERFYVQRTDAEGAFVLRPAPGRYRLHASAPGFDARWWAGPGDASGARGNAAELKVGTASPLRATLVLPAAGLDDGERSP